MAVDPAMTAQASHAQFLAPPSFPFRHVSAMCYEPVFGNLVLCGSTSEGLLMMRLPGSLTNTGAAATRALPAVNHLGSLSGSEYKNKQNMLLAPGGDGAIMMLLKLGTTVDLTRHAAEDLTPAPETASAETDFSSFAAALFTVGSDFERTIAAIGFNPNYGIEEGGYMFTTYTTREISDECAEPAAWHVDVAKREGPEEVRPLILSSRGAHILGLMDPDGDAPSVLMHTDDDGEVPPGDDTVFPRPDANKWALFRVPVPDVPPMEVPEPHLGVAAGTLPTEHEPNLDVALQCGRGSSIIAYPVDNGRALVVVDTSVQPTASVLERWTLPAAAVEGGAEGAVVESMCWREPGIIYAVTRPIVTAVDEDTWERILGRRRLVALWVRTPTWASLRAHGAPLCPAVLPVLRTLAWMHWRAAQTGTTTTNTAVGGTSWGDLPLEVLEYVVAAYWDAYVKGPGVAPTPIDMAEDALIEAEAAALKAKKEAKKGKKKGEKKGEKKRNTKAPNDQ